MTPVQLFGVAVRTIGLVMALSGAFSSALGLLLLVFGAPVLLIMITGIPALLVGLWLLRGPGWLIAFAYPEAQGAARFYPLAADRSAAVQ
jgi:hypothetical protein